MRETGADPSTSSRRDAIVAARGSAVAAEIRRGRLIIVLRRVAPRTRLIELVGDLVEAGAKIFEVTMDGEDAVADLRAVEALLASLPPSSHRRAWVGAGTVRTADQVHAAHEAGAAFGVSPVFDREVLDAALELGLPFMPGAMSPTEIEAAWRAGAALVKVFPGSTVGPSHIRELRGPFRDIDLVVTGGVDLANAGAFLEAGATAVGIGSAILRATPAERAELIDLITGTSGSGGSTQARDTGA